VFLVYFKDTNFFNFFALWASRCVSCCPNVGKIIQGYRSKSTLFTNFFKIFFYLLENILKILIHTVQLMARKC
jgi:hypothetical protein